MLGMPGECLQTVRESGKLLGEIGAKIGIPPGLIFEVFDIFHAVPFVGTPLYEYGKQLGLIGQSADEEEKYIELTSYAEYYKRYYINFSGAPISEVVFWDMLLWLEATRTFEKLTKNQTLNKEWEKKFKIAAKVQAYNPHVKSKQKKVNIFGAVKKKENIAFSNYFITNFLKRHIVFNRIVAKLPRFLVDPIVRYLLYFEFLIQKNFFKDKHHLHAVSGTSKKMNSKIRIRYEEIDPAKTTQKDRSLRTIVEKKMKELNRSKQEKTLSTLTAGP